MPKILFLSSHVGLGHVTRDYRISIALSSLANTNLKIDWCTAEPAYTYLHIKREKILDICHKLSSMSVMMEEYMDKKMIYRPLMLRKYLHALGRNYDVLRKGIDWDEYDLIVADEFWEIVLKGDEEILSKTIFITDIIFKNYESNPFESLASYILNKFYINVYPKFMERFYIGLPWDIPNQKTYFLYGEWMVEWIHKYFKIVGRIPSVPYKYRIIGRRDARNLLKLNDRDIVITVLLGGTKADTATILKTIEKFWILFKEKYSEAKLIMILGPRTKYKENKLKDTIIIDFTPDIGLYLIASNIVISRSGKTSVTDLEYLGIPSIIIPVKNHFEQKYIAKTEPKYFKFIKQINSTCNPKTLLNQTITLLKYRRTSTSIKYFIGDKIISKQIIKKIKN